MVLRTIPLNYDIVGPDTTHTYDSAQVVLLIRIGVFIIIINEGKIIIIGVEVHGLVLQVVIIITEVGVWISTDIFPCILPLLKLHVPLMDGLLQVYHFVTKVSNNAILLITQ